MSKPRSKLTDAEVKALRESLGRRLESVGIQTQPEVALKVLSLASRPDTQPKDFADLIKHDPGLSSRLLRLANSAMFAQRQTVTNIDRACLVLGLDRLKSITLGFHLSRAARVGAPPQIDRMVWEQSVYRACLSAEIARYTAPSLVPEAFVIGLLIDAGIPIMSRLLGEDYDRLALSTDLPPKLLRLELSHLEFTHVDVLAALTHLWRLPELLMQPLICHHDRPQALQRTDSVYRLHRIAYVAGSLDFSGGERGCTRPLDANSAAVPAAQRLLDLSDDAVRNVVQHSSAEYQSSIDLFVDAAGETVTSQELLETIQFRLVQAIDSTVEQSIQAEYGARQRFTLMGQSIEISREGGVVVAYLFDSAGAPLVSHRFSPGNENAPAVLASLGVDAQPCDELQRIQDFLASIAA